MRPASIRHCLAGLRATVYYRTIGLAPRAAQWSAREPWSLWRNDGTQGTWCVYHALIRALRGIW
jgi:hypothetical protein